MGKTTEQRKAEALAFKTAELRSAARVLQKGPQLPSDDITNALIAAGLADHNVCTILLRAAVDLREADAVRKKCQELELQFASYVRGVQDVCGTKRVY